MCMPVSQPLPSVWFRAAVLHRLQSTLSPERRRLSLSSAALANSVSVSFTLPVMVEGESSSEYAKYTGLEL